MAGDGGRVTGTVAGQPTSQHPDTRHPSPVTLDLIAALVEASLLRSETGPDGTARYRMLETIREFAEERLEASGEAEAIRERHAAYFLAFAERYELAELLPDGDRVLALLEAEHANLRVALAWLEERDEPGRSSGSRPRWAASGPARATTRRVATGWNAPWRTRAPRRPIGRRPSSRSA